MRMEYAQVLARATEAYSQYVRGHEPAASDLLSRDPTYKALCGRRDGHQDAFRTNAQMAVLMSSAPGSFHVELPSRVDDGL